MQQRQTANALNENISGKDLWQNVDESKLKKHMQVRDFPEGILSYSSSVDNLRA